MQCHFFDWLVFNFRILKILFLTPWYPDAKLPHHGVFVRDQAEAVSRKHEVIVISSKVDYNSFRLFTWMTEESLFGSMKEYRVTVCRSLPFVNQINYLLISVWVGYQVAKKFRPDIIHGNIAYPGGIWAYCVSKLISTPWLLSDHTSRFTDNFRSAFHRILTTFPLRKASRVIAVSAYSQKRIQDIIGRKVDIVPNVIHVEEYTIQTWPQKPVQIGFLGGLSSDIHRKGLDVLIKALAGVQKDFVLHIGGTGKYLDYYKEIARTCGILKKCRFHGFVGYVPDFMSTLHFFVSSSRVEAFGMVIAEALASGLPVVVTDSGGPADFISPDLGLMVPVEDVGRLRDSLSWMIDNYHTYNREKIRLKATECFSPEAFLSRIEMIYNALR